MSQSPKLTPDLGEMIEQLVGHVWPGGHRSPPILDEIERAPKSVDFEWRDGKAVPVGGDE